MTDTLDKAREAARINREAGIKPIRLDPLQKLQEKPTRKRAIDAMCWDCMGGGVGVRESIKNCTAPKCPLYQYRPYQRRES